MAETATASAIYVRDGQTGRDRTIFGSYKRLWSAQVTTPPWRRRLYYPLLHPSLPLPSHLSSQILISQTHMFCLGFHPPSFIVNSNVPPLFMSSLLPQFLLLLLSLSLSVPSSPDTDLALRFLCLGGVLVVGRPTVRAVVFTVVIGCPGVCHDQQLLDVSLEWRGGEGEEETSMEATAYFTPLDFELGSFFFPPPFYL